MVMVMVMMMMMTPILVLLTVVTEVVVENIPLSPASTVKVPTVMPKP